MVDHLKEALGALNYAESDRAVIGVKLSTEHKDCAARCAIAHALIEIAESLRWFKEQKEYDLNHKREEYRPDCVQEN